MFFKVLKITSNFLSSPQLLLMKESMGANYIKMGTAFSNSELLKKNAIRPYKKVWSYL